VLAQAFSLCFLSRLAYAQASSLCYAVSERLDSLPCGQIALALKQNKMRLPEKIAIHALWGTWVWGKP